MLIEHGARFSIHNNAGGKMLLNAVSDRNFGLCEKLLKDGMTKNTKETSNPSSSFRKAIGMIIQNELMETYDLLPKYFGNLKFLMKVVNETVIHDVIFKQNQTLCAKLVRDGVDINTRDNSGNFPIHIAALTGNKLILNLLLQNNASVNALNHTRQTVLHLAAKNGHKDILTLSNNMALMIVLTVLVKLQKTTLERMVITNTSMLSIFLCTVDHY